MFYVWILFPHISTHATPIPHQEETTMEYINHDLTAYTAVYEQQAGHAMPNAGRAFLRHFFQQAAIFRGDGYWDRRSGLKPLSREQINTRCVCHLTGNPTFGTPHLATLSDAFASAMADFYQEGFDLAEETEKEIEARMKQGRSPSEARETTIEP